MASRNKVDLIGVLGADPETRYMPNGDAVTNISLATSEKWKDKQTGEQKEITEWHRVVFFGKIAEIAGEYLRKGTRVAVVGKLRTRKWQDKDGQDRYTTEIVVDSFNGEMLMLSKPAGGDQQQQAPRQQQAKPQQQAREGYRSSGSAAPNTHQPKPQQPAQQDYDSFDDDIPF